MLKAVGGPVRMAAPYSLVSLSGIFYGRVSAADSVRNVAENVFSLDSHLRKGAIHWREF